MLMTEGPGSTFSSSSCLLCTDKVFEKNNQELTATSIYDIFLKRRTPSSNGCHEVTVNNSTNEQLLDFYVDI